jgi:GTP cyclohydrolase II
MDAPPTDPPPTDPLALDPLAPDLAERLARARGDLRLGLPVALTAPGGRRAIALAAETAGEARLAALTRLGELALAVTARRAETLKARPYDGDLARLVLPPGAGLGWVRGVADPATDLDAPLRGPFRSLRGGDAEFARAAIRLAKGARLLPAALVVEGAAIPEGVTAVPAAAILDPRAVALAPVVAARVPLGAAALACVHVFRSLTGAEEHVAVEIGTPTRAEPVLARLHSACFTGDLLGSLKCDCGPQLRGALAQMAEAGAGVLLYLDQEGRGIGLANKLRAYALQDMGFDTVEANHRLGFEDDERDFAVGARMLQALGFRSVRLLTNNPRKMRLMEAAGLPVVERVALRLGRNPHNEGYLATKAAKSGHLL